MTTPEDFSSLSCQAEELEAFPVIALFERQLLPKAVFCDRTFNCLTFVHYYNSICQEAGSCCGKILSLRLAEKDFLFAKFWCQKVLTKRRACSNILPVKKTTWMCR
jgi:hypothetical protein